MSGVSVWRSCRRSLRSTSCSAWFRQSRTCGIAWCLRSVYWRRNMMHSSTLNPVRDFLNSAFNLLMTSGKILQARCCTLCEGMFFIKILFHLISTNSCSWQISTFSVPFIWILFLISFWCVDHNQIFLSKSLGKLFSYAWPHMHSYIKKLKMV